MMQKKERKGVHQKRQHVAKQQPLQQPRPSQKQDQRQKKKAIFRDSLSAVTERLRRKRRKARHRVLRRNHGRKHGVWFVLLMAWLFAKTALASGDFNLDPLNDSVMGHIRGDFGKLMGLASIGWLIIGSVAGFNIRLLISVFVLMLAISFGPELVTSVVR